MLLQDVHVVVQDRLYSCWIIFHRLYHNFYVRALHAEAQMHSRKTVPSLYYVMLEFKSPQRKRMPEFRLAARRTLSVSIIYKDSKSSDSMLCKYRRASQHRSSYCWCAMLNASSSLQRTRCRYPVFCLSHIFHMEKSTIEFDIERSAEEIVSFWRWQSLTVLVIVLSMAPTP